MKALIILFLAGFLIYMIMPSGFFTFLSIIFIISAIFGAVTEYIRQENEKQ